MCVLWTLSSYMTWQIIPPLQHTETGRWPSDETWCVSWFGTFTSRKRTGRKRSLPIGTASPHLFHTLQKIWGRVKVCALCSEKKKKTPSGRAKETKYKCKQCDLPLCHVGCFWNTTSSEMWRCKIRWVAYYMHTFITNKLKKELSFCLFSFNCYDFFPWRGDLFLV